MRPERQISGVLKHKKRFKPKSPSTGVIKHAVIRNFFIRWIFLKETCNSHLGDSPSIFPSSSFHLQEFKQLQRALGEHLEQYWKDSKIESKCLLGQFVLSLTFVVHLGISWKVSRSNLLVWSVAHSICFYHFTPEIWKQSVLTLWLCISLLHGGENLLLYSSNLFA